MPLPELTLLTRGSPLALRQAELTRAHFLELWEGCAVGIQTMTTTGDRQRNWSLEKQGGKGLFTKELEDALLAKQGDLAVHSAKDLPTELPEGLVLAGFLPRAPVHDVLIVREGVKQPKHIATGSPRRRMQLALLYPDAEFSEIRGNIHTRLNKIAGGVADATMLAAAGLHRLGIESHEGLEFRHMTPAQIVPAVGQGAVALQCRAEVAGEFAGVLCADTARAVFLERRVLAALGGGCHAATAAHYDGERLFVFEEAAGRKEFEVSEKHLHAQDEFIQEVISQLKD